MIENLTAGWCLVNQIG